VTTFAPRSASEVADAVRWAMAEGEALEVVAGGTRRALGRPVDAPHVLDVSALSGVLSYEPEELILTALPATPLAEIEALLASRGQCLAFEPPYIAGIGEASATAAGMPGAISVGTPDVPTFARASAGQGAVHDAAKTAVPKHATLGGAVSTALSGPRRPKAGAVRDHVLGIAAVSGRGELFVGGGKVVKNVTGYDIPKLITGSYGTLAVLTEITIKVLPAPEDNRTLLLHGMTPKDAVQTMTTVLQSTAEVSGTCHLPPEIALEGKPAGTSATAFRLEGVSPSVEFRLSRLRDNLAAAGPVTVLDRDASIAFWRGVRDVTPLAHDPARTLWRVSVPPAQGAEVLARIEKGLPGTRAFLDWGGGLIWLQPAASAEISSTLACEGKIRGAIESTQGHATLIRAPADVRRTVNVFQAQPAGLAALSSRVKSQFDPKQVLNPGRMYAGV
jgi:glycolate oxidase FAD binding subunit